MRENTSLLNFANSKYSVYFIYLYFVFSAIKGATGMLWWEIPFTIISDVGIILVTLECLGRRIHGLSMFILASISIITLTSMFNLYSVSVLISGLRWQLFYMLAFIVGSSKRFSDWKFFDMMFWAVFITDLIGVFLYFMPPSWYMDYKFRNLELDYITDNMWLEMSRLSSFWPYPYWVSYGSAICYFYVLCQYYYGKMKPKKVLFFILFFLFVMLLAQQRLPLVFVGGATLVLLFNSMSSHNSVHKRFAWTFLCIMALIVSMLLIVLPMIVDVSILEFGIKKIETMLDNSDSSSGDFFLTERFGFIEGIRFKGVTLFGDGLGIYSLNPDASYSLLDNMWLTIFVESGIFGLFSYITIFLCVFIKGFRNLKYNLFELGILCMFIVGMFGANCLSKNTQHAIVLWLCCGRIFNRYCLDYKKKSIQF